MCHGPLLTKAEILRAGELRAQRLTWRAIGQRLGRDHAGLRRAWLRYREWIAEPRAAE